jgi:hypothetical protein
MKKRHDAKNGGSLVDAPRSVLDQLPKSTPDVLREPLPRYPPGDPRYNRIDGLGPFVGRSAAMPRATFGGVPFPDGKIEMPRLQQVKAGAVLGVTKDDVVTAWPPKGSALRGRVGVVQRVLGTRALVCFRLVDGRFGAGAYWLSLDDLALATKSKRGLRR